MYLTHEAPLAREDSMLMSPIAPQICQQWNQSYGATGLYSFCAFISRCSDIVLGYTNNLNK